MIEPKPLSEEEREEIERLRGIEYDGPVYVQNAITKLLDAEAYWRMRCEANAQKGLINV